MKPFVPFSGPSEYADQNHQRIGKMPYPYSQFVRSISFFAATHFNYPNSSWAETFFLNPTIGTPQHKGIKRLTFYSEWKQWDNGNLIHTRNNRRKIQLKMNRDAQSLKSFLIALKR